MIPQIKNIPPLNNRSKHMRRAAKIDDNQNEIVETFRKLGWTVQILSTVGKGCPDILIGRCGFNMLVEIKDGNKPPSKRELTPDQVKWHDSWRGQKCVIKNVDEALDLHDKEIERRIKAYNPRAKPVLDIIT